MQRKREVVSIMLIVGATIPLHRAAATPLSIVRPAGAVTIPLRFRPGPRPRVLSSLFGPAIGYYPIWSIGLGGHPATLPCDNSCGRTPLWLPVAAETRTCSHDR